MRTVLSSILVLLAVAGAADAKKPLIGRASVIDGDTIEIHGTRVRLFGIDAPEAGQTCVGADHKQFRCGQKAASVLDARIGDAVVTCEPKDTDQYGRMVAICRVYGEDLGAWMVGLGWAVAYRSYSTRYVPAEALAKRRKAGMWAGSFTAPAEWRKHQDQASAAVNQRRSQP